MFKQILWAAAVAGVSMAALSPAYAGLNGEDELAAPPARVGPNAAPGKAKVYSAVISSAGALVRGSATSASLVSAPNAYGVIFPVNVTACVFNATLGTTSNGTAAPGTATTAQLATNVNGVWVQTFDAVGNSVARDFHLVVTCP